jgi:hypothetical protein
VVDTVVASKHMKLEMGSQSFAVLELGDMREELDMCQRGWLAVMGPTHVADIHIAPKFLEVAARRASRTMPSRCTFKKDS